MRRLILSMTLALMAVPTVAQEPRILPNYLDLPLLAGDSILPGGTVDFVRLSVTRGPGNAAAPYIERLRSMGWVVSEPFAGETHVRRGEGETAICFLVVGGLVITADSRVPSNPYVEAVFQRYPCMAG